MIQITEIQRLIYLSSPLKFSSGFQWYPSFISLSLLFFLMLASTFLPVPDFCIPPLKYLTITINKSECSIHRVIFHFGTHAVDEEGMPYFMAYKMGTNLEIPVFGQYFYACMVFLIWYFVFFHHLRPKWRQ